MAYVIPKTHLGTAYGLFMALANFSLAVSPPFVGYIQDTHQRSDKFFWVISYVKIIPNNRWQYS